MQRNNGDASVWKGLVAGLAAGLVASWTMNQFQAAWTRIAEGYEKPHGAQSAQPTDGPDSHYGADSSQTLSQPKEAKEHEDDATVETARLISRNVFGHELEKSEKEPAGAVVHYVFGTATGGLYGAMAEVAPQVTAGVGIPFGAVFWLLADEIAVPLLGVGKGPTAYPVSTHVYSFASHIVYGATAELSRRAVRQVL